MIEIELKYKIDNIPEALNKLEFIKSKTQKDIYYDTKDYTLLKSGNFLRIRNDNQLQFKLNVGDKTHLFCNECDFFLNELNMNKTEINKTLSSLGLTSIDNLNTFEQICETNKFQVLAPIIKQRNYYKFNENCTILIDNVEHLGLFMENEIMINSDTLSNEDAEKIKNQLISNLQKSQILSGNEKKINTGYVELYLMKYNIEAYNLGMFKI